tara:strand:+ start:588 stop:761 length:174 start_codon:yes stop_codon:yes gene_type:complete
MRTRARAFDNGVTRAVATGVSSSCGLEMSVVGMRVWIENATPVKSKLKFGWNVGKMP